MTAAPCHKRTTGRNPMLLSALGPMTLPSAGLVILSTVIVACGSGPDAKTARQEKISVEFDVSVLRGGGTYHYQVWQTP